VAGRLSSPRLRRRIAWSGALLGTVGAAAVVSVLFWNTADYKETFSGGEASMYVEPTVTKLSARDRRELIDVARKFLTTAVTREDPGGAFEIVGPGLKGGTTRRNWSDGEIPVVPYPVDEARWKFDYSFAHEVGLQVLVFPRPGENVRPALFMMALVPANDGGDRRWLVDSWVPRGGSPNEIADRMSGGDSAAAGLSGTPEPVRTRLGAGWLLVPFGGLVLALLAIPAAVIIRDRRATRRARLASRV
jgi:hypothetical protein